MINDDKQLCSRKSNDIIQNYSWHLTKRQLKLFEYLCCCVGTYHYNEEKKYYNYFISGNGKRV